MKSSAKSSHLLRRHLDNRLKRIPLELLQSPRDGWIRSFRKSLGMSGAQLARRLGINKQSLAEIESSEKNAKINLSTLKKVAEGLDSQVYLTLVPNKSLEETLKERAQSVAERIALRNRRNMDLEGQTPSKSFYDRQIHELSEDLMRNLDKRLWDDL